MIRSRRMRFGKNRHPSSLRHSLIQSNAKNEIIKEITEPDETSENMSEHGLNDVIDLNETD